MKTLTAILSLTLSFFLSSTGIANAQETTSVSISQGQVTVTPARCHPDFCEIQIAKLEGTLAAQINLIFKC